MNPRRTIATTHRYEEAEALVDRLADDGFPVQHVAVVGRELEYVEQVTGHLNGWKAALTGAVTGIVLGLLLGTLFAVWFAHDGTSLLAIVAYWTVLGAVAGTAFSLVGYLLQGGRRNFTSTSGMQPRVFDVVVDDGLADEAVRLLAGFDRRPHPIA